MTEPGGGSGARMLRTAVIEPAAWRGEDLQNSGEWIVRLGEADADEIECGLADVAGTPAERRPAGLRGVRQRPAGTRPG